jgi:MoxR-like ATPase
MTMRALPTDATLADLHHALTDARRTLATRIFGQEAVIEETLVTVLAGGHGLLVGVPGLAKTLLVTSVAEVLGLDAKRLQCTPDLMPSDILGSEVLEENPDTGRKAFRFLPGPVFGQLVMADEINRASPRTQSALLQAMQERAVTVAGHTHALPRPFHVLATQNPVEQEGTYPLPEAQLDRFLLCITVGYPDEEAERTMLLNAPVGTALPPLPARLSPATVLAAQDAFSQLPVGDSVVSGILALTRRARPELTDSPLIRESLSWGAGPRAGQALLAAAKVRAALDGRSTPSLDDVAELAPAVLRHRLLLNFTARAEGRTVESLIAHLVESL